MAPSGKAEPFPVAALAQHTAIVGKTGAGKTSTAKLLVEQVVDEGARVCVLDPIKSDWWGVKASADGKRPGLPFTILGGPHGHMPLHHGSGAVIAELVACGDLPLSILDMAEFPPGKQLTFFVDFVPVLLKRMRGVVYFVWEEAHLFVPKERSGMDREQMAIHWGKTCATAGRSKGIRLVVATQRTQALHNAVLGSCDTLIAHRLTAPADQEPVQKWLKANVDKTTAATIAADLAKLQKGDAWLCSGEAGIIERRTFPKFRTFDNSATPTDDAGEMQVRGYDVDLEQLRSLIGDTVAEFEANDPKKLKAQVAQLQSDLQLAKANIGITPAEVDERVGEAVRTFAEDLHSKFTHVFDRISDLVKHEADEAVGALGAIAAHAMGYSRPNGNDPATTPQVPRPSLLQPPVVIPPERLREPNRAGVETAARLREPKTVQPPAEGLSSYEQKILDTMASLAAVGVHDPTREVVAVWADKSYTSSTYEQKVGKLGREGYLVAGNGRLQLTPAGASAGRPAFVPRSLADLHEAWRRTLEKRHPKLRAMLDVLLEEHPQEVTRDELAKRTNQSTTSSTTEQNFGALSALGVTVNRRGSVGLSDLLFPAALRARR